MLNEHIAQASDNLKPPSISFHKEWCAAVFEAPHRPLPWKDEAEVIAKKHGLTLEFVLSRSSARRPARARWEIMAMLRARGNTYPRIGQLLGGMDHSSVLHGCRRHAEISATDA